MRRCGRKSTRRSGRVQVARLRRTNVRRQGCGGRRRVVRQRGGTPQTLYTPRPPPYPPPPLSSQAFAAPAVPDTSIAPVGNLKWVEVRDVNIFNRHLNDIWLVSDIIRISNSIYKVIIKQINRHRREQELEIIRHLILKNPISIYKKNDELKVVQTNEEGKQKYVLFLKMIPDSISFWAKKRGEGFNSWSVKRRWFVYDNINHELHYYDSSNTTQNHRRGSIKLTTDPINDIIHNNENMLWITGFIDTDPKKKRTYELVNFENITASEVFDFLKSKMQQRQQYRQQQTEAAAAAASAYRRQQQIQQPPILQQTEAAAAAASAYRRQQQIQQPPILQQPEEQTEGEENEGHKIMHGYECARCGVFLTHMNMLHGDDFKLTNESKLDEKNDDGVEVSTSYRFCTYCTLGHCPDCGEQIIPDYEIMDNNETSQPKSDDKYTTERWKGINRRVKWKVPDFCASCGAKLDINLLPSPKSLPPLHNQQEKKPQQISKPQQSSSSSAPSNKPRPRLEFV